MSITIDEIVEHARDQHPALSEQNAPVLLAYRFCSRLECALYDEIWRRVPALLAQKVTIALPLADFNAGISLATLIPTGWKDLLELRFKYPDPMSGMVLLGTLSRFMPYEQRDMAGRVPAHTLLGDTLYLLGTANDYLGYQSAELTYTGQPAAFTTGTDTLHLPDDALETFAYALAAFYMRRLIDDPVYKVPVGAYREMQTEAEDERKEFLSRIFRTTQRQNYAVRDVG